MLRKFYKLGMMHALHKHAVVGELAMNLARRKAIGEVKGQLRETLGLETPEWRQGSTFDIPELAAVRAEEEIRQALAPEPEIIPEIPPAKVVLEDIEPKKKKQKELKLPKPKISLPKK